MVEVLHCLLHPRFSTTLHSAERKASTETTFLHFQAKAEPNPLGWESSAGPSSHTKLLYKISRPARIGLKYSTTYEEFLLSLEV